MTLGPLLPQVAGFGRSTAIQTRPISPLRIQLDAVGRIGHQQLRFALPQKPGNRIGVGGIAAQYAVATTEPQIAGPGHGNHRHRGRGIFIRGIMQQVLVEFLGIKPGQAEIEVGLLEFRQFNGQQVVIPIGPGR